MGTERFDSHSQAYLIIHTLETPPLPSQGVLDSQSETSQVATIQHINQELRRIASEHKGVYLLDYDALIARYGRIRWHDERKWLTMRMPIAADNLMHLANEWLRFIHPLTGKVCKVLVTDLDNTLWGGVIGEDGLEGIQIGAEYPGAAYRALQRAMLDLLPAGRYPGGLQQEQPVRCHGSARTPSRHAVTAATLCSSSHQLGR